MPGAGCAGCGSAGGVMVDVTRFSPRLIVTGPSGAGKTTFCQQVVASARAAGWQMAGLLSLPRFEDGRKTGIIACDLFSGEQRLLASCRPNELRGLTFGQWNFDSQALAWGNAVLEDVPLCDLLIVDELGPLEFDVQQGWTSGFQILARHTDGIVLAAIRPSLLARLQAFWPNSVILDVRQPHEHMRQEHAYG